MSDVSLDKLIESIKEDAIASATKESDRILADAKEKAGAIINEARSEKQRILDEAETEANGLISKGESTLRQAARDMQTVMRNDILKLLGRALDAKLAVSFNADVLKRAIEQILSQVGQDVEMKISPDLETELAAYIRNELKVDAGQVVTTRDPSLLNGVKLIKTQEGWSYDITAEEVGQLLKSHLTDQWISILDKPADA